MLIPRHRSHLRKVRGQPQHVERAEGKSNEIDPADDHGRLSRCDEPMTVCLGLKPCYIRAWTMVSRDN